MVSFLVDLFSTKKLLFCRKKISVVKYETHFSKDATDNKRGEGKFFHRQKLEFFKVIHNVKLR